jgi:hypothetical protein
MKCPHGEMNLEQTSEQLRCPSHKGVCIVRNSLKHRCSGTAFSVLLPWDSGSSGTAHVTRKLAQIANAVEAVQDGGILIE